MRRLNSIIADVVKVVKAARNSKPRKRADIYKLVQCTLLITIYPHLLVDSVPLTILAQIECVPIFRAEASNMKRKIIEWGRKK